MTNSLNGRKRISSNFTLTKIFIYVAILFLVINLITVFPTSFIKVAGFSTAFIFFGALLYYCHTRPIIYYDQLEEKLSIKKYKTIEEIEVPIENINKILFSAFGLNLSNLSDYSYVIVYTDNAFNTKKIRLFPITFSNDISQLIKNTKAKNPNVMVRNWSFGLNELFD